MEHIKTREAFSRLKDGSADDHDFDRVAVALNLAKVRAMSIDEGLANMLERAQGAMTETRARKERTGRWGFDGPGLVAVSEAMDAHEPIVDASSPLQMKHALGVMHRSLVLNQRQRAHGLVDSSALEQPGFIGNADGGVSL